MPEPLKIPAVWANGGDYNDIPQSNAGTGLASWSDGFPPETQTPLAAGGTPPRRQDMNGALNAITKDLLWYQQGGFWEYDAALDYERGNVVLQNNSLYFCINPNGAGSTAISPAADTAGNYWKSIIFADGSHPAPSVIAQDAVTQVLKAVYPVGAIYCSTVATSPDVLFGFGTWSKIEGRFLLGASSTYASGSTGGAATVALTVNQLPAHNHAASSASAGAHTHTVTVNSGGAHTHTASTASAGAHTHTRGTMEIVGEISSADTDEYLIYADDLTATGAFRLGAQVNGGFVKSDYAGKVHQSFNFAASRSWTGSTSSAGAHTHAITVNSGGAHTHTASSASAGAHTHAITTSNTGGGQAHNNMPPYMAVYMWRRVS